MSIREDELIEDLQAELAEYKQRAEAAEAKLRELEMQEPTCKLYSTAPEVIYLQISDDESNFHENFPSNTEVVTWCADSVLDCEVVYIRADMVHAKSAPKKEEK